MKTVATVISVSGGFATVETERTSACEGCHKMSEDGKGCAVCSLVGGSGRKFQARAENPVGAKVGDRVSVESTTSRVLFYAVLVFILPLVLCAIGWGIAAAVTTEPLWQAVGALSALVISFIALRIYSGVLKKRRADVVITEILSSDTQDPQRHGQQDGPETV